MTGMWSIVVCDLGIGKCCRLLCKGFTLMVYFERVERNYGSTKRIADLQLCSMMKQVRYSSPMYSLHNRVKVDLDKYNKVFYYS